MRYIKKTKPTQEQIFACTIKRNNKPIATQCLDFANFLLQLGFIKKVDITVKIIFHKINIIQYN